MSVPSLGTIEAVGGQSWPVLSSRDLKLSVEVLRTGHFSTWKPHKALSVLASGAGGRQSAIMGWKAWMAACCSAQLAASRAAAVLPSQSRQQLRI